MPDLEISPAPSYQWLPVSRLSWRGSVRGRDRDPGTVNRMGIPRRGWSLGRLEGKELWSRVSYQQWLPWCLSGKESTCNAGDARSIPGWGRSLGEGNRNPLQYSCLEDPTDREAWWATVNGVTKSCTQLCDWACKHTSHSYQHDFQNYFSPTSVITPPYPDISTQIPHKITGSSKTQGKIMRFSLFLWAHSGHTQDEETFI